MSKRMIGRACAFLVLAGVVLLARPAMAKDIEVRGLDSMAVSITLDMEGVKKAGSREHWPRVGVWESEEITPGGEFKELLPSWNTLTPPETGVSFEMRFKNKSGEWSPWLYLGEWGRTQQKLKRVTSFEGKGGGGKIDVDLADLKEPHVAYQWRVTLESYSFDKSVTPTVKLLSAQRFLGETKVPTKDNPSAKPPVVNIDVPFRTALGLPEQIRSECCSPLSTSMVMAHWGIDLPVHENAMAIYDRQYDLFGNWSRAASYAGSLGLRARLIRLTSMEEAYAMLEAGKPLVLSIRFKAGEFPSNLLPDTKGHIIVLRGFTEDGRAIVNDPASAAKGHGVLYDRDDLARAWLGGADGVAYLIEKP